MLRALRGQIEIEAQLKVSSRFSYSTDHPKEGIETPGYFIPLFDWFSRGDIIRVISRYRGDMEICEFYVTYAAREDVRLQKIADWAAVGDGTEAAGALKAQYTPGNKTWRVTDETGNTVARGLSEDQAKAIAKGERSVPEAA